MANLWYILTFPRFDYGGVGMDKDLAIILGFLAGLATWGLLTFSNPLSLKDVRSPFGLLWWAIKVMLKGFSGAIFALIILYALR